MTTYLNLQRDTPTLKQPVCT